MDWGVSSLFRIGHDRADLFPGQDSAVVAANSTLVYQPGAERALIIGIKKNIGPWEVNPHLKQRFFSPARLTNSLTSRWEAEFQAPLAFARDSSALFSFGCRFVESGGNLVLVLSDQRLRSELDQRRRTHQQHKE
jgi:hypothetical protein